VELHNSFIVPSGIDDAWATLMDIERVAPCMPGATLVSYDGEVMDGKVKVKVGPVQMTYAGKATFRSRDESGHTTTIEASGREARGSGTAAATATATLHEVDPGTTRVEVLTDLTVTGKAAQFGRGVMQDVAARIVDKFAENLAVLMSGGTDSAAEVQDAGVAAAGEPTVPAGPGATERAALPHQEDAIDLMDAAGAPVLKRALPVLAALGLVGLLWWLVARRRGR
jgi:uncharacterized protein